MDFLLIRGEGGRGNSGKNREGRSKGGGGDVIHVASIACTTTKFDVVLKSWPLLSNCPQKGTYLAEIGEDERERESEGERGRTQIIADVSFNWYCLPGYRLFDVAADLAIIKNTKL